jgi:hypothetical protein
MKIIQWTYTIPKDKQEEFIAYYPKVLSPIWRKHGAKKCELFKVEENELIKTQKTEKDTFQEMLFFDEDFDIKQFFASALEKDRERTMDYEKRFGAKNIEFRILYNNI